MITRIDTHQPVASQRAHRGIAESASIPTHGIGSGISHA